MELKWQDQSIAVHSSVYVSHGDIMGVGIEVLSQMRPKTSTELKEAGLMLQGAEKTMQRNASDLPDVIVRTYYENSSILATFVLVNVHFSEPAATTWFSVQLMDFFQAQSVKSITHIGTLRLREVLNPTASVFCTKSSEFSTLWDSQWKIEDFFLSRLVHFASVAEIDLTLMESEGYASPSESLRKATIEKLLQILKTWHNLIQIPRKSPFSQLHTRKTYDLLYN